jgi:hypothetical protein
MVTTKPSATQEKIDGKLGGVSGFWSDEQAEICAAFR